MEHRSLKNCEPRPHLSILSDEPRGGLQARNLSRNFDGIDALQDVSLSLQTGQVLGLLGPNGAGKSTLVNLLSGFDQPTKGQVELDDVDITAWRPARRGLDGLARTFQNGHAFAGLTVRENVEVAALGVKKSPRRARTLAREVLEQVGLAAASEGLAGALPHGDGRLLGVARALATEPRLVLMDEPAAGLNDDEVGKFGELLTRLATEDGIGLLLIDHNIGLVFAVCDEVQVLDEGRTIAFGSPEDVRQNPDVATAYLGQP